MECYGEVYSVSPKKRNCNEILLSGSGHMKEKEEEEEERREKRKRRREHLSTVSDQGI